MNSGPLHGEAAARTYRFELEGGCLGPLEVSQGPVREPTLRKTHDEIYIWNSWFNGDVGRVLAVSTEEKRLSVDFDGNVVSYEAFELDGLTLAYALTIHKSQGSEFPAVVVPVLNSHHIMLQRNLLYTAITRARKLVVLVGDPKAIAAAVGNDTVRRRYTALATRLGKVV